MEAAVYVGADLETLNKDYGTRIIISSRTRELAGDRDFDFRELGDVQVRGKHAATSLYAVEIALDQSAE